MAGICLPAVLFIIGSLSKIKIEVLNDYLNYTKSRITNLFGSHQAMIEMNSDKRPVQLIAEIQDLLAEEEMFHQASNRRYAAIKEKFAVLKNGIGDRSIDKQAVGSLRNRSASGHTIDREKSPSEKQAGWLTLAEAARLAELHRGTITRIADSGQIKDNGEKGHGRRVEKRSVLEWMGKRILKQRQRAFADYNKRLDDIPNEH
jgi:hypothetical protein